MGGPEVKDPAIGKDGVSGGDIAVVDQEAEVIFSGTEGSSGIASFVFVSSFPGLIRIRPGKLLTKTKLAMPEDPSVPENMTSASWSTTAMSPPETPSFPMAGSLTSGPPIPWNTVSVPMPWPEWPKPLERKRNTGN